jgi:general stress protein 26
MSAMENGSREKLFELLHSFRTAMLVTIAKGGAIRARPMALQKVAQNGDLWFMTDVTSSIIQEVGAQPRVTATFQRDNAFVAIEGRAAVSRDQAKIDELWTEHAKVYFPKGKEDPDIVLVRLIAEQGEYWDNEGLQGIKHAFEAVKAYVSGARCEAEDEEQHAAVQLDEGAPPAGTGAGSPRSEERSTIRGLI